jgi:hypothetical protein
MSVLKEIEAPAPPVKYSVVLIEGFDSEGYGDAGDCIEIYESQWRRATEADLKLLAEANGYTLVKKTAKRAAKKRGGR